MTEKEKMLAGALFRAADPAIQADLLANAGWLARYNATAGVAPDEQHQPLILSAAFTRTLSPEKQRALRGRWFRLHFQYLCAFDRPGDYDYFAITAGPLTLGQRFAGRQHSPGRIARAVNR